MLLEWSSRYDHVREVTREDIVAARDDVTGKQRESRIVALRSLFRHAKKNGRKDTFVSVADSFGSRGPAQRAVGAGSATASRSSAAPWAMS